MSADGWVYDWNSGGYQAPQASPAKRDALEDALLPKVDIFDMKKKTKAIDAPVRERRETTGGVTLRSQADLRKKIAELIEKNEPMPATEVRTRLMREGYGYTIDHIRNQLRSMVKDGWLSKVDVALLGRGAVKEAVYEVVPPRKAGRRGEK